MSASKTCTHCRAPNALKACAACFAPFCNAKCQRSGWSAHKTVCQALCRPPVVDHAPPPPAISPSHDEFSRLVDAMAATSPPPCDALTDLLILLMRKDLPLVHFNRTTQSVVDASGGPGATPQLRNLALRVLARISLSSGPIVALRLLEVEGLIPLMLGALAAPEACENLGGVMLLNSLLRVMPTSAAAQRTKRADDLVFSGALHSIFALLARCPPSAGDTVAIASNCVRNLCTGSEARKAAAMAAGAAASLTRVLNVLNEEGETDFAVFKLGGKAYTMPMPAEPGVYEPWDATVNAVAFAISTLASGVAGDDGDGATSRATAFTSEGMVEELGFSWSENPELQGAMLALCNFFVMGGASQEAVKAAVPKSLWRRFG